MSLIDREFFIIVFYEKIEIIAQFIRVQDIDICMHNNLKFILLNFYIHEKTIDNLNIIYFKKNIYRR